MYRAYRRCLSLQRATMTSRLPNTVMRMMMERKMVRTMVSSEARDRDGGSGSGFKMTSNKLHETKLFS